ncbi:MAG: hypothetical protein R2725_04305 [Solirubrobacterales bacterium]
MRQLKSRLSYANVTATIALFLALGGGAAFAAGKIGPRDIAPGAVRTNAIHKRAVISGKIAGGAVRGNQVARNALGSDQIKPGSIRPDSLQVPVTSLAAPSGGAFDVTAVGSANYPLANASWTQSPGQVNLLAGEVNATLALDEASGKGSCQVFVAVRANGGTIGTAQMDVSNTALAAHHADIEFSPLIDPTSSRTNALTVQISSLYCAAGSQIDSSRFRVMGIG